MKNINWNSILTKFFYKSAKAFVKSLIILKKLKCYLKMRQFLTIIQFFE